MTTVYWKWEVDGQIQRVFRWQAGLFQMWKKGRWQQSDMYERALEDPEFLPIKKAEADVLITMVGVNS